MNTIISSICSRLSNPIQSLARFAGPYLECPMGFFKRSKPEYIKSKFPEPLPQHRWLVAYVCDSQSGRAYGNFQYCHTSDNPKEPNISQTLLDCMDERAVGIVNRHPDNHVTAAQIIIIGITYLGWTTDREHGV